MASHPRRARPGQEFPAPSPKGRCAPQTSPYPPGLSWRRLKRRNSTGFSPISSRFAHRAPGPSGSPRPTRPCRGCSHPPRRSPGQAASSFTPPLRRQRRRRSPTSRQDGMDLPHDTSGHRRHRPGLTLLFLSSASYDRKPTPRSAAVRSSGSSGLSVRQPSWTHWSDRSIARTRRPSLRGGARSGGGPMAFPVTNCGSARFFR